MSDDLVKMARLAQHDMPSQHGRRTMGDDLVKLARHNALSDMPHYASVELIEALADRIEELEAKLAKAVGLLEAWVNVAAHCTIEEGVCCCGDSMDTHAEPMDCGHSPVDHGAYVASRLVDDTSATLAELTGGKDE